MNIGLIDVDCHANKKKWGATIYPNLALCKISAYHKSRGDSVEWATIFEHYDILYKSRTFNFSEDDLTIYNADKIIKGGTGYNIESKLPNHIDMMQPDYSIYPNLPDDIAYGFLTRGCPNKCKWCVVPRKEGIIHPYWDIEKVLNGKNKAILMDNNILAAGDYCAEQLDKIIRKGVKIDFNQALDARLVNRDNAKLLAQIKWLDRRIRFGCDTKAQIDECERAISLIQGYGYKGEFFLYTMLNDNFDECYNRLMYWWKRNKECRKNHKPNIYPYSQPYRDPDKLNDPPQWQKDMAGWCNKRMVFTVMPFEDFEPRKGFKCMEYLK